MLLLNHYGKDLVGVVPHQCREEEMGVLTWEQYSGGRNNTMAALGWQSGRVLRGQ